MPLFNRNPNLQKLAQREDVQGLIKALQHASEGARAEIVQILADIRDPRATEALMKEAEQGEMSIRHLAVEAIKRIDPDRKYVAAIHMLNDVHRNVRTAAAGILAMLGNPKALDALLKTLATDSDAQARAAAAQAVGALKDRRALNPLIAALHDHDDRVRIAAAHALAQLGDRTALDPLMRMHEAETHPDARTAADQAITQLQAIR